MEMVAREANVAKATLYSYFKTTSCSSPYPRIARRSDTLAKPDMALDDRLTEAVISKRRLIFTLVRGSAHAAELFSYTHEIGRRHIRQLDRQILRLLGDSRINGPALRLARGGPTRRALYFGSAQLASRCNPWRRWNRTTIVFGGSFGGSADSQGFPLTPRIIIDKLNGFRMLRSFSIPPR